MRKKEYSTPEIQVIAFLERDTLMNISQNEGDIDITDPDANL